MYLGEILYVSYLTFVVLYHLQPAITVLALIVCPRLKIKSKKPIFVVKSRFVFFSGMDWVAENRVLPAVASMSLGGYGNSAVDEAINRMYELGVVTAVAAGNSNNDACIYSPARARKVRYSNYNSLSKYYV